MFGISIIDIIIIVVYTASFSSTRLMRVPIKRFLTQLICHNRQHYDSFNESFR